MPTALLLFCANEETKEGMAEQLRSGSRGPFFVTSFEREPPTEHVVAFVGHPWNRLSAFRAHLALRKGNAGRRIIGALEPVLVALDQGKGFTRRWHC